MIDISKSSGLPISLSPRLGTITFGDGATAEDEGARVVGDLLDVLAVSEKGAERRNEVAYLLYRGVHRDGDESTLVKHGLRYDVTVTLPGEIGGEYMKTAGHIHSLAPDGVGYPEIYDVLYGQTAFVLQFDDPLRVVIALCGPGERILIPPGASHLTVNLGPAPLVVADLVAIASQNDYGEFRERRGAAVHLFVDGNAWKERINPAYGHAPIWHVLDGSRVGDFVPDHRPLYTDAIAHPDQYQYLTAPSSRSDEMRSLWSSRLN